VNGEDVCPDYDVIGTADPATCIPNTGQCRDGSQTCMAGAWMGCSPTEVGPSAEVCNGLDDDCNGYTDEGLGNISCGKGACLTTVPACLGGFPIPASGCAAFEPSPGTESCNNVDDDCDGYTDNAAGSGGNTLAQRCDLLCLNWNANTSTHPSDPSTGCAPGVGQCSLGSQLCSSGTWGGCANEIGPSSESCNALDDDCDGYTDNAANVFQSNTLTATLDPLCEGWNGPGKNTCVDNAGQCRDTTQTCQAGGWVTTIPEIGPSGEACNMLDDDCDGYTDNKIGSTANNTLTQACDPLCATTANCHERTGRCQDGAETCSSGAWGTCAGEIGPTGETCNNLDDNCDGYTDNRTGSTVAYSLTQSCDSACVSWNAGGHGTTCRSVGQCRAGTQTCSVGGWSGTCAGEIGPTVEACNNADDDCDGYTDNSPGHGGNTLQQAQHPDCDSWTGSGKNTCVPATGQCKNATQTCATGSWSTTTSEVGPSGELCNNLDDDCDGFTDNAVGSSASNTLRNLTCDSLCATTAHCIANTGQCRDGTATCQAGSWGTCASEIGPSTELCNGLDDNCDGYTDNVPGTTASLTQSCDSACASWNANPGAHASDPETACQPGVGRCANGTQSCSGGAWGASCPGETGPSVELCNGLDDDCDGYVDNAPNDFASNTLQRQMDPLCAGWSGAGKNACQPNVGQCHSATQTCLSGSWNPGTSEVGPSAESCNALDDDCDGYVDNAVGSLSGNTLQTSCDSQCAGTIGCRVNTGQCRSGNATCTTGSWGSCQGETGPTSELCNGLDDNCDGYTDNAPGSTANNSLTQTCASACSSWNADTSTHPTDAEADCHPGIGQCRSGTQSCSSASWGACAGETGPTAEMCNGLDDDCDGYTDNNPNTFTNYSLVSACSSECGFWKGPGKNTCIPNTGQCRQGSITCSTATAGTVATNQSSPWAITTGPSGAVYWVDQTTGSGLVMKSASGVVSTIASGQNTPTGIAVDSAENVYWTETGAGLVLEESGGVISTVSSGDPSPSYVTVDSLGNVYWTDQSAQSVMEESGGVVTTISSSESAPYQMAADGAGNIYWLNYGNAGSIVEYTAGGLIQTLASSRQYPIAIAADAAGDVYWVEFFGGTVVEYSGGTLSTLASGLHGPLGIAVDNAGDVYVTNNSSGAITKTSHGTTTAYATTSGNPRAIAVDSQGSVYWTDVKTNTIYGPANVCRGESGPSVEVCNNLDDDCDGYTDNDVGSKTSYSLAGCSAPPSSSSFHASAAVDSRQREPVRTTDVASIPRAWEHDRVNGTIDVRAGEIREVALREPSLLTCDVSCTGWDGGTAGECPE
jgi:sugar lactone lactonase YvrE